MVTRPVAAMPSAEPLPAAVAEAGAAMAGGVAITPAAAAITVS
jgi:hypothetical protein